MKKLVIVALVALLAAPAFAGELYERQGERVEGEYICHFVDGINARAFGEELGRQRGVKTMASYNALNSAHFSMDEKTARKMAQNSNIAFCEPNLIARVDGSQSGATWGIDRVDQRNLPLNSTYNWDFDGSNVDAWVLDTGVRTSHNDFGGRASTGYVNCNGYGHTDGLGHGRHVAGSLGGTSYGVAKNVSIKSIKVCSDGGSCPSNATSCGLNYVANNHSGDSVGNFSIGGPYSSSSNSNMANVVASGVFFAVAAGNDGVNACNRSPASEPTAYTVGCSRSNDSSCGYNGGSCVDIVAPGYQILSAWYTSNSATATISGTSMSSPHVAGAGALVLEESPGLTPAQVDAELDSRATTGVLTGQMSGTPDRLLYTLAGGGGCTPTEPTEVSCSDGQDNDCDGLIDGADPDCATGGSCPTGYNHWTGTASTGDNVVTPDCPGSSGTFHGILTCSGADHDLYLEEYTSSWWSSGWSTVASSTSSGCNEEINTSDSSGNHRWRVYGYSGTAAFDLCTNQC